MCLALKQAPREASLPLNQVQQGDALRLLGTLPSQCVQAVIADPPYYNVLTEQPWDCQWRCLEEYLCWCEAWTKESLRVLKPDGLCFIFGQVGKREHGFIHLMSRLCQCHQFHDLLIWDRVVGYNQRRDSFTPAYEMILVLRKNEQVKFNKNAVRIPYNAQTIATYLKDKRYKNRKARQAHLQKGKFSTNILTCPSLKGNSKEKCGHPSQKPLGLLDKLVLCATDTGDIVLDPFLGSGATAMAAQQHGRPWIGIEQNAQYCRLAEQRLAAAQAQQQANAAD